MGFEHHIKGAGFAERVAIRAFNIMLFNGFIHLLHGHALWVDAVVLQDVVGAVAAVVDRILAQRIDKGIDMPTGLPYLGFMMIAASTPYISSRPSTKCCHHSCIILRLSATPSGP